MSIDNAKPSYWENLNRNSLHNTVRADDAIDCRPQSDGATALYYKLPKDAVELQDLISFKNMNAQIGEAFRSCYRYGEASHSDQLRDAKKIKFYAEAEIKRLTK